ncbi:MAG: hypothetical protein AAF202_00955 [Pseudomonadota bacterium]
MKSLDGGVMISDYHLGLLLGLSSLAYFVYFQLRLRLYYSRLKQVAPPKFQFSISWLNWMILAMQLYLWREWMFGNTSSGTLLPAFGCFVFALVAGFKRAFYVAKEAKIIVEKYRQKAMAGVNTSSFSKFDFSVDEDDFVDNAIQKYFVAPLLMIIVAAGIFNDIGEGYTVSDLVEQYGGLVFLAVFLFVFQFLDLSRD